MMRYTVAVVCVTLLLGGGSLVRAAETQSEESADAAYHHCTNNMMTWHDDKRINPGQMALRLATACHKEGEVMKQVLAAQAGKKLTPQLDRALEQTLVDADVQEVLQWRSP